MNRQQRERKRERVSARATAEKQSAKWVSTSIKIPAGINTFNVKQECVKRLDFLTYIVGKRNPYKEPGSVYYERSYFVHSDVGIEKNKYVCPFKELKKPCPICEYRATLGRADGDEELKKMIKALQPKHRQLWLLYDLDEMDKGAQIWDFDFWNFGKELNEAITASDVDDEYEFFADLETGLTLRIKFAVSELRPTYFVPNRIDFKPRKKQYSDDLMESLPCLDDMIIVEPYDKLKELFEQGQVSGDSEAPEKVDDDYDDDDDEPAPTRSRSRRREAVEVLDDDDDDGNDPDIVAEEEQEVEPEEDELDPSACIACEGTKKTRSGRTCPICKGSGKSTTEEPDDEPPAPKSKREKVTAPVEDADDDDEWANWDD